MQVEIKMDSSLKEPKIIILTDRMTDEVRALFQKLSSKSPQLLMGICGDTVKILDPVKTIRFYTNCKKVLASTPEGEYPLRLRLYELEERLDSSLFVRISHSEIINLKMVKSFDLSLSGTICVLLSDGTVTYVSRRYVAKIKQVLGI